MVFGSTSKNIGWLTSAVTLLAVAGPLLPVIFSPVNILTSIFCFYLLNIVGVWMMLHRYYSHRSFEFRHPAIRAVFSLLAVLSGRGSILGWVYIHRLHHKNSDTAADPHSPLHLGYKIFGFGHYSGMEREEMKVFIVKDLLSSGHLFIHKYYMLLICTFALLLGSIDFELLYFCWIVPVTLIQLSQNNFNFFSHKFGYRNFETTDNSRNSALLFPFILGEAWHNNHHGNPRAWSTAVKRHEVDPVSWVIRTVMKK